MIQFRAVLILAYFEGSPRMSHGSWNIVMYLLDSLEEADLIFFADSAFLTNDPRHLNLLVMLK